MTTINQYFPNSDPDIARRLGRIEQALFQLTGKVTKMAQASVDAINRMTSATESLTTEVDAIGAFIDANVQAQRDLAAELEADGVDAAKIHALADTTEANKARLIAYMLRGTPSDPGVPIPPVVTP